MFSLWVYQKCIGWDRRVYQLLHWLVFVKTVYIWTVGIYVYRIMCPYSELYTCKCSFLKNISLSFLGFRVSITCTLYILTNVLILIPPFPSLLLRVWLMFILGCVARTVWASGKSLTQGQKVWCGVKAFPCRSSSRPSVLTWEEGRKAVAVRRKGRWLCGGRWWLGGGKGGSWVEEDGEWVEEMVVAGWRTVVGGKVAVCRNVHSIPVKDKVQ